MLASDLKQTEAQEKSITLSQPATDGPTGLELTRRTVGRVSRVRFGVALLHDTFGIQMNSRGRVGLRYPLLGLSLQGSGFRGV